MSYITPGIAVLLLITIGKINGYELEFSSTASLNNRWNFEFWNKTNFTTFVELNYEESSVERGRIVTFRLVPGKKVRIANFINAVPFYIHIWNDADPSPDFVLNPDFQKKINGRGKGIYLTYEKPLFGKLTLRPQKGGNNEKTNSGLLINDNLNSADIVDVDKE